MGSSTHQLQKQRHKTVRPWNGISGMKVNFSKCEAIPIGMAEEEGQRIADLLKWSKGPFFFSYQGLPCVDRCIVASDWDPTVEKVVNRCDPWQGKLMSSAALLTLTKTCLSAIPTLAMCFFILGECFHSQFNMVRTRFFWEVDAKKCKYHMVRWADLCRPKAQGGLGILNSSRMNITLSLPNGFRKFRRTTMAFGPDYLKSNTSPPPPSWVEPKVLMSWTGSGNAKKCFSLGLNFL